MADTSPSHQGLRVLIAGGGVAALEALVALRALAADRVGIELIAPEPMFFYRPLAVAEPFGAAHVAHFELARISETLGAAFTLGQLSSVDTDAHRARTAHGAEIPYDVLLVANGASPQKAVDGALTIRGPADTEAISRIIAEADQGNLHSLCLAIGDGPGWPLPLYELALLARSRLTKRGVRARVAVVTSEHRPLEVFGPDASEAVAELLEQREIELHSSCRPIRFDGERLETAEGLTVRADHVIAMPRLEGQRIYGLPHDVGGFLATDPRGRVRDLRDVYAAGDVTAGPIKQGGLAAQQAATAAEAIAARVGAEVEPELAERVLRAVLLTGGEPLYLRRALTDPDDHGTASTAPLWWPPAKIVGRNLAPFLAELTAADAGSD